MFVMVVIMIMLFLGRGLVALLAVLGVRGLLLPVTVPVAAVSVTVAVVTVSMFTLTDIN